MLKLENNNLENTISIFGCGWLGEPLAESLLKKGAIVKGSTTSVHKLECLKEKGIASFLLDIAVEQPNELEFLEANILIVAIPSKDINGFKRLIAQIEKSPIQKVIFISSTSVYPSKNSVVEEEDADIEKSLAKIEALFQENTCFKTTIIRFGGLFGGDRKPGNWFKNGRKIPHPEGFVNMIHRVDCVAIIEEVIKQEVWNEIFSACSPHHPKRRDFYMNAKASLGLESPEFEEKIPLVYKIVSPKKLIQKLGYRFQYEFLLVV